MIRNAYSWPTPEVIAAAPAWLLRHWWLTMPTPRDERETDVVEAMAVRCEGCGLVGVDGNGAGVLVCIAAT